MGTGVRNESMTVSVGALQSASRLAQGDQHSLLVTKVTTRNVSCLICMVRAVTSVGPGGAGLPPDKKCSCRFCKGLFLAQWTALVKISGYAPVHGHLHWSFEIALMALTEAQHTSTVFFNFGTYRKFE